MRPGLLCLLVLAAGCSRQAVDFAMNTGPRGELAPLAWLTGSWVLVDGTAMSEEHWTRPHGDTMLGMNRTVRGGRTVEWEALRIEATDRGVVYFAAPRGRFPATAFLLVEQDRDRVVFENPDHDFPRRISYHRRGPRLDVRIEGEVGGEPRELAWTWKRTSLDAMPP